MADSDVEVKFGAQIEGLVAGVNNAKSVIESISEPISGVVDAFQSLGEAAVAGLAIDRVYDFQKELAELGEQIERTSKLTGLSSDEVQQFQFAVKATGGDAETAAASLLFLERNIAQAQSGAGRAFEAFKNMGVSLNDLKTKSPNDILLIMAQRFSETGENAQQAALKIDYMRTVAGRAGTNLIPLLNEGPEGLKKLSDTLDQTNSKLSPEMVEALAASKKASIEADAAWKGFYITIGSNAFFAKVTEDMSDLAHAATEVAKAVQQAGRAFDDFISGEESRIPTETEKFIAAANELKAKMGGGSGTYGPTAPPAAPGNPLPQLSAEGTGGKEDNTATQIAQDQIKTQEELAKIGLATQRDLLEQEVAAKQISKEQEFETLQAYLGLEYQVESEALDKKLALYSTDSREYQQTLNQKTLLDAQYQQQLARLAAQGAAAQVEAAKKTAEQYKAVTDVITRSFDTALQGVLTGTQSWQQAMGKVFSDLASSAIEAIGKIIAEWLVFEVLTEGQGTWSNFMALEKPGGGGVASLLPSFDVGSWSVPNTGAAFIHAGEMIIPATQASAIRSGSASLGGGSSGGASNVNITIQAIDTQTGAQFLKNNAAMIAQVVAGQSRNFNPNVRGF